MSSETEALEVFDAVIHDARIQLDMTLESGDQLFANDGAVMQSRSEFVDHEDSVLRGKLMRLWGKAANTGPLAPGFRGRNGFPVPVPADS